ncbi:MAG: DUF3368 domain-containing protein [Candidatus Poribacteria bacterium]|nr:DUF3368 domain-containing protein [Candidatus Poribacteria bacterium]
MSKGPVVSDTSPLISLLEIKKLSLLRDLYTEVLIPRAVENEFLDKFPTASREALDNAPWIRVVDLQDPHKIAEYANLDLGEAEALVLVDEKKARLVLMDENRGRKAAKARGFIVKRTLALLLEAKEKGLIDKAEPYVIALKESGMYITDSVIRRVLEMAGEAD